MNCVLKKKYFYEEWPKINISTPRKKKQTKKQKQKKLPTSAKQHFCIFFLDKGCRRMSTYTKSHNIRTSIETWPTKPKAKDKTNRITISLRKLRNKFLVLWLQITMNAALTYIYVNELKAHLIVKALVHFHSYVEKHSIVMWIVLILSQFHLFFCKTLFFFCHLNSSVNDRLYRVVYACLVD